MEWAKKPFKPSTPPIPTVQMGPDKDFQEMKTFCPFLKSSLPTLIIKMSSSILKWKFNVQNMISVDFLSLHNKTC